MDKQTSKTTVKDTPEQQETTVETHKREDGREETPTIRRPGKLSQDEKTTKVVKK